MTLLEIIDLIVIILCCVTYAVMMYFKVKGNVLEAVSELIAQAEETGLTGSEKMAQVVQMLSERVPAPLKKILSDETLKNIAQKIFNWMRKYADNYLNSKTANSLEERKEKLSEANIETTAELLVEIMNMTASHIAETAADYGIEITEEKTREEVVRDIIVAIINKA